MYWCGPRDFSDISVVSEILATSAKVLFSTGKSKFDSAHLNLTINPRDKQQESTKEEETNTKLK